MLGLDFTNPHSHGQKRLLSFLLEINVNW